MGPFLVVIKIIVIMQLSAIFFFVLFMYLVKSYFVTNARKKNKAYHKMTVEFIHYFDEKLPFPARKIKAYRKAIEGVLQVLKEMEYTHGELPTFPTFVHQVSEAVLRPVAKIKYQSRKWLDRYYAVRCYGYGFLPEDEVRIAKLLQDDALIVSIHAAQLGVDSGDSMLVNYMITIFAKGRHLQQSFFSQVLNLKHCDISDIVVERIREEDNPYVKLFCYRLMSRMGCSKWINTIKDDLETEAIDLKVGVLDYLCFCTDPQKNALLYANATSSAWVVRAAVAKALSTVHTRESIELLSHLLTDNEWWVRINSANSLYQLGDAGIAVLEAQSPAQDKFAYETAQKVLLIGK
ncbi:MAG: HEAT repeat domain-containing protein [Tatlockia sp.]|jgi:hypothetical protein